MSLSSRLVTAWYAPRLTLLTAPLVPLAVAFGAIVSARRALFRLGALRKHRMPVPVIVVGNITVGGTGKTPLTAMLARALAERGWHPGIVSRGHGRAITSPGPVLVAAERTLVAARPQGNVIVADDGLQHYRLARDFEIVAVDAMRGLGNGWQLPAGPLREPPARLYEGAAVLPGGTPR